MLYNWLIFDTSFNAIVNKCLEQTLKANVVASSLISGTIQFRK